MLSLKDKVVFISGTGSVGDDPDAKVWGNGKATAVVHGEGASIGLPPLPLPLPLTVQLHAGDGACWEATYDAGGVVQDQLQLRARGSRPRGPRS